MLDEVFRLRQCEAVNATSQALEHIEPHEALRRLLTMEVRDITAAVDSNPAQVRKLIRAALKADNTLTPREVPEDRHSIVHTVLTWQVNAHKLANPSAIASPDHLPHQPTLTQDQQPPQLVRDANQAVEKITTPGGPNLQTATAMDQPTTSLQDFLVQTPRTLGQRGPTRHLQDLDDSDEEPDARTKRARDSGPMETWIEVFHTGTPTQLWSRPCRRTQEKGQAQIDSTSNP